MDGNKFTVWAALIAALASAYSAYHSGTAAREASIAAADSNNQVAALHKATNDRQSDIEMVKLALNILGGVASDKTKESRRFAVSLLRKYSGVEVDDATGSSWAAAGTVSFAQQNLGLANDTGLLSRAILKAQILEAMKNSGGFDSNNNAPQMQQNTYPNPSDSKD